jgi:DNA-binding NarL/FixJ family response regulator
MPAMSIVMLAVYDEGDCLSDSLRAGASGYLLKRTPGPRLPEALRAASQGGLPSARRRHTRVHQCPDSAGNPALTCGRLEHTLAQSEDRQQHK